MAGSTEPVPSGGAPPLKQLADASLFFSFDGALVAAAEQPDGILFDDSLGEILNRVAERIPGRVAIICGRSLDQLRTIVGSRSNNVAIAGSHGAELQMPSGEREITPRPQELDCAIRLFKQAADQDEDLSMEIKSLGVALHYRAAPEREKRLQEFAKRVAADCNLRFRPGDMMVEVCVPGEEAAAVQRFMKHPGFKGTRPLFFGSTAADEAVFEAVGDLGGEGVLVGRLRASAARYDLPSNAALRRWLGQALNALG